MSLFLVVYTKQNLIPEFILNQNSKHNYQGNFNAAVLFLDISGFTSITEQLMEYGNEGAEVISTMLNNIFSPLIQLVHEHHGFIANFIGDALVAIFPQDKGSVDRVVIVAWQIRDKFTEIQHQNTPWGKFKLSIKMGLSLGKVNWYILNARQKIYYFSGPGITKACRAEKYCSAMDIVMNRSCLSLDFKQFKYKKLNNDNYLLQKLGGYIFNSSDIIGQENDIKLKLVDEFISPLLRNTDYFFDEFREVVAVFIAIQNLKNINQLLIEVIDCSLSFGGYISGIDFADKGPMMLVLFGAPVNYENNLIRSVRFAEQLTHKYTLKIKIGLNFGSVFAGVIGSDKCFSYTCLGDSVNFASRIATRCQWGDVWMSEKVAESIQSYYQSVSMGLKKFKGKKNKQTIFKLKDKTNLPLNFQFPGQFMGREKELKKLTEYIQPITKGKFGGIVHIKGEAGIGKSRLISEFLEKIDFPYQLVLINPDQVNQISMYGLSRFLKQYFQVDNFEEYQKKTTHYEIYYSRFLQNFQDKKRISELNRIKTILGAIIGLHWENSIYEKIKPEERPQVIMFAFKEFIISLSSIKPLIIVVEDFQWLDKDSIETLTILTRSISSHPIIIILLSRNNEKDKLTELPIDQSILVKILSLEKFSDHLTENMVKHFLNIKPDQEFLHSLHHKAQGNPLFIEQYCLYLKNKYTRELTPQIIQKCQIPSTVNSILIARIDQLNKSLKELVKLASVFGMEFRQDCLTEVINIISSRSESFINHLFEGLDLNQSEKLMKEGIDQNIWNILTEMNYSFNHSLFRDAAYQMQLKKIIRTFHLLIAELFSKKEGSNPEQYHYIAYHFHQAEKFEKAIDFYSKAAHYSKENYKIKFSIDLWKKALHLTRKIYPEKSKQLDLLYLEMTKTLLLSDKFNEALNYLDRTNISENFGTKSNEYAELLYLKASALEAKGEYSQALKQQLESKDIRLKLWNENNIPISENLEKTGWIYWDLGKYDKAIELWSRSLKIREKLLGKSDLTVADTLDDLGTAYSSKGDYEKSYSYHQRALKIRKNQPNRQDFALGYSYNNLACLLKNLKKLKQALVYSLKSLDLLKSTIGEKCNTVAKIYNNIGVIYWDLQDYQKSLEYHLKNISLLKEIYGPDQIDLAFSYNNIASVYLKISKFSQAIHNFNKSVEIFKKVLGENHPNIGIVYFNIAETYKEIEDLDNYFNYHHRSLEIKKNTLGGDHPITADSYRVLGTAYFVKQDYKLALQYSKQALNIMISRKEPDNNKLAEIYLNLGRIYFHLNNIEKSEKMLIQSRHLYHEINSNSEIKEINKYLSRIKFNSG